MELHVRVFSVLSQDHPSSSSLPLLPSPHPLTPSPLLSNPNTHLHCSLPSTSPASPSPLLQQALPQHTQFDLRLLNEKLFTLLRQEMTEDAWQLFEFCRKNGHTPSSLCLSRLVAQLSYRGTRDNISRAQSVFAELQKDGKLLCLDCNSLGLLAMASSKAGAARYASEIIRIMLQMGYSPHVKAWSAVVSKLGSHFEDVHLALQLFDEICIRVEAEDNGDKDFASMRPDTGAFNAILNACATGGLLHKGEELFAQMGSFDVRPDALTFNILIKLYGNAGECKKLGQVLDRMEESGVEPCFSTMHSLVAAYVGLGEVDRAERIVQALQVGVPDVRHVLRSKKEEEKRQENKDSSQEDPTLMTEFVKEAVNQSQENPVAASVTGVASKLHKFKPDVRMYSILMKGYKRARRFKDVVQLLIAMQHQEDPACKPNEVTYTTAISACLKLGALDQARAILTEMASKKVPANIVTYNVLLNGYCKASRIQEALCLIKEMEKSGIMPDVVSFNTIIDGFISLDDNEKALQVFRKMRQAGIAPSKVSYTSLMKAFVKTGQSDLVAKVFEEMKQDPSIIVDAVSWNLLIESYSKDGLVEAAKKTFKSMKGEKLQPTIATYGSLVKCFAKAGKPGEALVLWNEIYERLEAQNGDSAKSFRPDAGLLDALVDICVRAGFFQRAMEIIACMEDYQIPANKIKYKRMFVELHSKLYTSKHASQARRDRYADRRSAVEAFKYWVGLPNNYYK